MTGRTSWCSLWKPSLQRGTELLKYQTQRWIPLQTYSLFFTVRSSCGRLYVERELDHLLFNFVFKPRCTFFLISFCLALPFKPVNKCFFYYCIVLFTLSLICFSYCSENELHQKYDLFLYCELLNGFGLFCCS